MIRYSLTTLLALFLPALLLAAEGTVTLTDPLNLGGDPAELYGRLIKGFTGVAGAVALFFFVLGGFKWLASGGSDEKIKKGRDTLVWATLGLIVILGSYFILSYIINVLTLATG